MHIMGDKDSRSDRSRRVHSAAFKHEMVMRSLEPGASVSAMALAAGINADLLFGWRRVHLAGKRSSAAERAAPRASVLLPVEIARVSPAPIAPAVQHGNKASAATPSPFFVRRPRPTHAI
jgi:transposase